MRDWNKYHKRNVAEGDCQLVTACNAYYHLTGNVIDQESDQYQEFVDLCGCNCGSAIDIENRVWPKLGIIEDQRFKWFEICHDQDYNYEELKQNLKQEFKQECDEKRITDELQVH